MLSPDSKCWTYLRVLLMPICLTNSAVSSAVLVNNSAKTTRFGLTLLAYLIMCLATKIGVPWRLSILNPSKYLAIYLTYLSIYAHAAYESEG